MESVELKLRLIDNNRFVTDYTKKVVEMLGEPEMSLEVKDGQISDISQLIESLGYHVTAKRPMDGWVTLKVAKQDQ
jgi:hypothetical protein